MIDRLSAVDDCGGVGLYSLLYRSTDVDYAKLLSAFLAGGGPILKQSSIDEIMKSQLVDPKYFLDIIHGPGRAHLGQTWPVGANSTFGLSDSVSLEDFERRRKKGSANWSGIPGCHAVGFAQPLLLFYTLLTHFLGGLIVSLELPAYLQRRSSRQETRW